MMGRQQAIEYCNDQMQRKLMTTEEATIMIVKLMGVCVVTGKIPKEVRKVLNDAVKKGLIGHLKKNGLAPEVYHHNNARFEAVDEQRKYFNLAIDKIKNCLTN